MDKIITVPFGALLDWLCQFTGNYGIALIIFAVIVQLVMMPVSAKSKKSMMKMSRLQPRIAEIQQKYANDKQKQNEAIQKLQQEEGATMGCGGCLWSLVPMLIMIPLYSVVRQRISQNVGSENFLFFGIDLGLVPSIPFISEGWKWEWAFIGAALIPLLSAAQQVLAMKISQRNNNSVVTDKNGMEDKETAKKSQANQTAGMMTWMMPIMSLWIGFSMPAALSLYWLVGGIARMIEDVILTKRYRKVYDAEDAVRLEKYMAEQALEEEKERQRAKRREENPEGITENTSKKKLQKKQQQAEEAAKAAAAKEYAAQKGVVEEAEEEKKTLSGIADRPYCKGRAYDPNRYSQDNTEE